MNKPLSRERIRELVAKSNNPRIQRYRRAQKEEAEEDVDTEITPYSVSTRSAKCRIPSQFDIPLLAQEVGLSDLVVGYVVGDEVEGACKKKTQNFLLLVVRPGTAKKRYKVKVFRTGKYSISSKISADKRCEVMQRVAEYLSTFPEEVYEESDAFNARSPRGQIADVISLADLIPLLKLDDVIVGWSFGDTQVGAAKKRRFANQMTFLVHPSAEEKPVNIKLFKNGSISMTGCHSDDAGYRACKVLLDHLRQYPEVFTVPETGIDVDDIEVYSHAITLINCDCKVNYKINLEKLHALFTDETRYGILSEYEPAVYPGVKLSYMWNDDNAVNNGRCQCQLKERETKCVLRKKQSGTGHNRCKKITVCIFHSGKIIITGGDTYERTDHVYNFISEVLQKHRAEVVKHNMVRA